MNGINWPQNLISKLQSRMVVPFVGAGVSMAVRRKVPRAGGGFDLQPAYPGWRDLLELAASRLIDNGQSADGELVRALLKVEPPRYLEAAEEARRALRAEWIDFLMGQLGPSHELIDADSLDLARAVWELGTKLIITTNFDRVLRWGCPEQANLRDLVIKNSRLQLEVLREQPVDPTIWYLHGSIDNTSGIVLTRSDYEQIYGKQGENRTPQYLSVLFTLIAFLAARTFLFIGFSMDDAEFSGQVAWIDRVFEGVTGPHYMLVRKAEFERARERLKSLPVHPIPYPDHGPPLIAALRDLAKQRTPTVEAIVRPAIATRRIGVVLSGDMSYTHDILHGFRSALDQVSKQGSPELVIRVGPREATAMSPDSEPWREIAGYLQQRSKGREFDYFVGIGTQASVMLRLMLGAGLDRGGRSRLLFLGVTDRFVPS